QKLILNKIVTSSVLDVIKLIMDNIIITADKDTPYFPSVTFDAEKGECTIAGESYMEDCYKFYTPLIDWLTEYCNTHTAIVFNFKLYYFNTQSSRMVLKIIEVLMHFKEKGGNPEINWFYYESDPDMIDEVEDFKRESGLEINLVAING
ncbi:MAG TPA: DUF1987 domain-containing protein, partial [Bacteroidales bacterium]